MPYDKIINSMTEEQKERILLKALLHKETTKTTNKNSFWETVTGVQTLVGGIIAILIIVVNLAVYGVTLKINQNEIKEEVKKHSMIITHIQMALPAIQTDVKWIRHALDKQEEGYGKNKSKF